MQSFHFLFGYSLKIDLLEVVCRINELQLHIYVIVLYYFSILLLRLFGYIHVDVKPQICDRTIWREYVLQYIFLY